MNLSASEYEWVTHEHRTPRPDGEQVSPDGPWENATLIAAAGDASVGEAWFKVVGSSLLIDVQIGGRHGGANEEWVRRLLAEALFGEEGLTGGFYHSQSSEVQLRNLTTGTHWVGLWSRMAAGNAAGRTERSPREFESTTRRPD